MSWAHVRRGAATLPASWGVAPGLGRGEDTAGAETHQASGEPRAWRPSGGASEARSRERRPSPLPRGGS